jgi:hypothetical protein
MSWKQLFELAQTYLGGILIFGPIRAYHALVFSWKMTDAFQAAYRREPNEKELRWMGGIAKGYNYRMSDENIRALVQQAVQ